MKRLMLFSCVVLLVLGLATTCFAYYGEEEDEFAKIQKRHEKRISEIRASLQQEGAIPVPSIEGPIVEGGQIIITTYVDPETGETYEKWEYPGKFTNERQNPVIIGGKGPYQQTDVTTFSHLPGIGRPVPEYNPLDDIDDVNGDGVIDDRDIAAWKAVVGSDGGMGGIYDPATYQRIIAKLKEMYREPVFPLQPSSSPPKNEKTNKIDNPIPFDPKTGCKIIEGPIPIPIIEGPLATLHYIDGPLRYRGDRIFGFNPEVGGVMDLGYLDENGKLIRIGSPHNYIDHVELKLPEGIGPFIYDIDGNGKIDNEDRKIIGAKYPKTPLEVLYEVGEKIDIPIQELPPELSERILSTSSAKGNDGIMQPPLTYDPIVMDEVIARNSVNNENHAQFGCQIGYTTVRNMADQPETDITQLPNPNQ